MGPLALLGPCCGVDGTWVSGLCAWSSDCSGGACGALLCSSLSRGRGCPCNGRPRAQALSPSLSVNFLTVSLSCYVKYVS